MPYEHIVYEVENGIVLKAVPPDLLEAEVEGLADRMALIDPALLAANKRIVNLAMELMGAQVLQRLAAENDARGHLPPATKEYFRAVQEKGLAGAFRSTTRSSATAARAWTVRSCATSAASCG